MNGKTHVCLHIICMPLPSFAQLALANKSYFWKRIESFEAWIPLSGFCQQTTADLRNVVVTGRSAAST